MHKNSKISFLQVWGIILVVIGHSGFQSDSIIIEYLHKWIGSFSMPLFMFISGFLFRYSSLNKGQEIHSINLLGWNGFIWKKIKRLLIPGLLISSLAFLPKCLLSKYAVFPIEVSWKSYLHMYLYPWDNAITFFWFIPTLFIIFMLIIIINKVFKKENNLVFLYSCLFIALILNLYNPLSHVDFLNLRGVMYYLFYFMLGDISCKAEVHIYNFKRLKFLLTISLLASILFIITPDFFTKSIIKAINGIFLSLLLANIYIMKRWTFINHLFGKSSVIYMYSWFAQAISQQILLGMFHIPTWSSTLLAVITGIYFPVILSNIVNSCKKKNKLINRIAPFWGL